MTRRPGDCKGTRVQAAARAASRPPIWRTRRSDRQLRRGGRRLLRGRRRLLVVFVVEARAPAPPTAKAISVAVSSRPGRREWLRIGVSIHRLVGLDQAAECHVRPPPCPWASHLIAQVETLTGQTVSQPRATRRHRTQGLLEGWAWPIVTRLATPTETRNDMKSAIAILQIGDIDDAKLSTRASCAVDRSSGSSRPGLRG